MAVDLADILNLLQERSQHGRNLVFRHVADLFLAGTLPESNDDRAALVEILRILRPKVDLSLRRELSGHLYSMEHPPMALLDVLLDDVDEVSGPLLDYAAIPESIMNRLIESAPIEVISRLKRRRDLPADLRARIDRRFAKPTNTKPESEPLSPVRPAPEPAEEIKPAKASRPTERPTVVERAAVALSAKTTAAPSMPPRPAIANTPYYPDLVALQDSVADMHHQRVELRDFVRASSDWQWETDRDGKITYLSDGAARAFGRPVAALIERPFTEVLSSQHHAEQEIALEQAFDRRSAFDDLAIATRGFESSAAWKLAAVPMFDLDSGRFQGYRGVAEDITTTPVLDVPANTNTPAPAGPSPEPASVVDSSIADAIQSLSHELRTPLNAILGFSEMIELETWGKINEDYRRCVRNIIEAARQLNELINDILENARLRPQLNDPYPKSFSISSVIQDSIEAVAAQAKRRRIAIETASRGLRAIVYSDPRLVHYSLVRLLRSALEDSRPQATITLRLTSRDDGSVDIDIPFVPETDGGKEGTPLSALSQFRLKLAEELATAIGATVSQHHTTDGPFILSLRLPPHARFPAAS